MTDRLVFNWDDANVAHVARHNVTRDEVEQAFANDPMDLGAGMVDDEEGIRASDTRISCVCWFWPGRCEVTQPAR